MPFIDFSRNLKDWVSRFLRSKNAAKSTRRKSRFVRNTGPVESLEIRCLPAVLSINDIFVVEGQFGTTEAVFTVTLSVPEVETVSVVATSADGEASFTSDYMALFQTTLTFLPGETSKNVSVMVNGDNLVEPNENFFINLSNPINATIGDGEGLGTIVNDDGPSASILSINDVTVIEGEAGTSNAVFTVNLGLASEQVVTVVIKTEDVSASFASDYIQLPPTTLTFLPGELSKTVTIAINGDSLVEPDETFFVNLAAPENAVIGDGQGQGTILNDDGPNAAILTVSDVVVVEGNVGVTEAVFIINLSTPGTQTISVNVSTSDGDATFASDYVEVPPTLVTFLPGETSKTVTVNITGDIQIENDEAFFLNLANPVNAVIGDSQGLGLITDDDGLAAYALSIDDISIIEGDFGVSNAIFTITLATPSADTITVVASTSEGTASLTSDYIELLPTTITFLPGETTKLVSVAVNGDTVPESNEAFFVNLSAPVNAIISDSQGQATILEDDGVGGTGISINDVVITEGNQGTINAVFMVSLVNASTETVSVLATVLGGTATSGSDYVEFAPVTLVFLPGETSKLVSVVINADSFVETSETFFVNLSSPMNGTLLDAQGLGTILDDDGASSIGISIDDVTVSEGNSGTTAASFTLTLTAPSTQTVTVLATSMNGTATSESDYGALTSTIVTFLPGETSKTLTISIHGDRLQEEDETLLVNLSAPVNAILADSQGQATIVNDDGNPAAVLSIDDITVTEGNAGTSQAVATVTLNAASSQTITVVVSTSDGSASATSDYFPLVSTTLTFLPGETSKALTITINSDFSVEPNESFLISLSEPTNATISDGTAQVTIVNDDIDEAPTVSIDDIMQTEGNDGTKRFVFAIALSAPSRQRVTVTAQSANDTALANLDYIPLLPTIYTFEPGEIQKEITITVIGDRHYEESETLLIYLTDATYATLLDNLGIATLVNDDPGEDARATLTIPPLTTEYRVRSTNIVVAPEANLQFSGVTDPSLKDAILTATISAGYSSQDRLSLLITRDRSSSLHLKGHRIILEGVEIGRLKLNRVDRKPTLAILLNTRANTDAANQLLQRIGFLAKTNPGTTRTVKFQVSNIATLETAVATQAISVV